MNNEHISCIYKATNKINGKIYIGSTKNFHRRKIEHRCHARKDGGMFHHDILLFGFDNFEWTVLQEVEPNDLCEFEKKYISEYRKVYGTEMIYNIARTSLSAPAHR